MYNYFSLDTSWGLVAYLGTHNILPTVEDNAVVVIAYDVVVHPEWEPSTIRNDIAIIRLQEPVQFSGKYNNYQSEKNTKSCPQ